MTVYMLDNTLQFPDPNHAEKDGLVAVGGDLSPERLILGYASGLFPWYDQLPILWFLLTHVLHLPQVSCTCQSD